MSVTNSVISGCNLRSPGSITDCDHNAVTGHATGEIYRGWKYLKCLKREALDGKSRFDEVTSFSSGVMFLHSLFVIEK